MVPYWKRPYEAPRSFQRHLMHRIYRMLREPEVVLRFDLMVGIPTTHARHGVNPDKSGTVDDRHEDVVIITLDPRYDIVAGVVHECLHVIYEDATELQVQLLEQFVVQRMHPRQARHLLHLMSDCLTKKTPTE